MNENEQIDKLLIDGDIQKTLTNYVANVNHEVRQDFPRVLLLLLKQQSPDEILANMHLYISAILVSSEDKLPIVRQSLVEQIPYIFLFCREYECFDFGYYFYVNLVQIILQCLRDNNIEVRREAYSTLQNMLLGECLINKKQIEDQICPIILQQSPTVFPEAELEFVLKAITIMSRIVPIIGPKKTEEFFLNNFIELCTCSRNNVRKACAAIFPIMCYVLGPNITETKLLEPFTELCNDIFWGVRKTSAEAIPLIALVCSKECRKTKLASIVLVLTEDISKSVVTSTFKILGEFISTFAEPCITGLAYTYNRDLKIINPTDPDFTELSDSILMDNYAYYVNKFQASSLENVSQQHQQNQNLTSVSSSTVTSNSTITTKSVSTTVTDVSNSLTAHDIANNILENKDKLIKQINGDFKQQRIYSTEPVQFISQWEIKEQKNNYETITNKNSQFNNLLLSPSSSTTFTPKEFSETVNDLNFSKSSEWFNSMSSQSSSSSSSSSLSSLSPSSSQSLSTTPTTTLKERSHRLRNLSHREDALLDLPSIIRSAMDLQIPTVQQQQQQKFNINVNNTSMLENDNNGSTTASIESPPSSLIWNEFKNFCDNHEYIKKNPIENEIEMNKNDNKIIHHKSTIIGSSLAINNENSNYNKNDNLLNISSSSSSSSNNNNNEYSITTRTTNLFDISDKNIENNNCNDYDDDTDKNDKNMKNHSNLTITTTTITSKMANLKTFDDNNKLDNDNLDSDDDLFNNFNSYNFWHIEPEKLSTISDDDLCKIEERNIKQLRNTRNDLNNINSNFMDHKPKFKESVKITETFLKDYEQQNIVPPNILKTYVKMVLELNEEEINLNCAYSFPAVALTIGKENWNLIKPVMQYLCDEIDWKVRKTIAASIDILAGILGRDITTNDLVPIYLGFFKDLDEVKIEAIRNFANFLKMVDLTRHDEILSNVGICLRVDSTMNWRIKEDLAKQILPLVEMYKGINKQDSLLYLTSLVGVFLEDKISCVREIAANALAAIVRISDEIHQKAIIEIFIVQEFALSSNWRKRQTFLNILHKLITYADQKLVNLFCAVIDHIEKLSNDSVPNIRIIVAKIIVQLIKIRGNVLESKSSDDITIVNILKRLREDNDRDVREITYSVLIDEEKCLLSDELLENDEKINAIFHLNNSEDLNNRQRHESKDSDNENWDHETSFCIDDHDHDQESNQNPVSMYETSPPVNEMVSTTTTTTTTETYNNLRT